MNFESEIVARSFFSRVAFVDGESTFESHPI